MAIAAFFLFMTLDTSNHPQSARDDGRIFSHMELNSSHGSGTGWEAVEAFTESRRRQAVLLRMAL
jgi:hypothetical protein